MWQSWAHHCIMPREPDTWKLCVLCLRMESTAIKRTKVSKRSRFTEGLQTAVSVVQTLFWCLFLCADGGTPLHYAVGGGHLEVVRALSRSKVNMDEQDKGSFDYFRSPWLSVFPSQRIESSKFTTRLLPTVSGTAMHVAARTGNAEMARLLTKLGAVASLTLVTNSQ